MKKAGKAVHSAKPAVQAAGFQWEHADMHEHEVHLLQRFLVDVSLSAGLQFLPPCIFQWHSESSTKTTCSRRPHRHLHTHIDKPDAGELMSSYVLQAAGCTCLERQWRQVAGRLSPTRPGSPPALWRRHSPGVQHRLSPPMRPKWRTGPQLRCISTAYAPLAPPRPGR